MKNSYFILNHSSVGRMGIDPRTVKKYVNQSEFPTKRKQKRRSPVMDSVKSIIVKWIKENLSN